MANKQNQDLKMAQRNLKKIIETNYKPLEEEFDEKEFMKIFAEIVDKRQRDKKEIMMNCFFSAMIIFGGVGVSWSIFNMLKLFGGISFLDAILSISFIGVFIMIARTVWD